jgi:hypothetical protein
MTGRGRFFWWQLFWVELLEEKRHSKLRKMKAGTLLEDNGYKFVETWQKYGVTSGSSTLPCDLQAEENLSCCWIVLREVQVH